MLKRKPLVGEKIIITNALKGERDRCPFDNGDILEVVASNPEDNYVHVKPFAKIYDEEYTVYNVTKKKQWEVYNENGLIDQFDTKEEAEKAEYAHNHRWQTCGFYVRGIEVIN